VPVELGLLFMEVLPGVAVVVLVVPAGLLLSVVVLL
jgi:hypothetical protein